MKSVTIMLAALLIAAGSFAQAPMPRVHHHQREQQNRIGNGVKSGALTPRETISLERQQAGIQHDKRIARRDGHVTRGERRRIAMEQRRASRHIYRAKHNRVVMR